MCNIKNLESIWLIHKFYETKSIKLKAKTNTSYKKVKQKIYKNQSKLKKIAQKQYFMLLNCFFKITTKINFKHTANMYVNILDKI